MRILVVGGYGLIGSYVVSELAAAGHKVTGGGRDVLAAGTQFPFAHWQRADLAWFGEEDWAPLLEGIDVVVNCAGALQDSPQDHLEAVHVSGIVALGRAAKMAEVDRFIHISAAGVSTSPGEFGRTKRAAEAALAQQDIDWVILRPGLVLAPSAFGGSALLRGLAGFPLIIPCIYPNSRIQVVAAEDIARAVVLAIDPKAPRRIAVDLISSEVYELRDILSRLRCWLGLRPAPVIAVPAAIARMAATVADGLAWLGWRSPMRSAAVAQLRHGVRGDADSARSLPNLHVRNLEQILAAAPAGVQERWFARLSFLKPLGLAALACFWAASGILGFVEWKRGAALLVSAGFAPAAAISAVLLGSAIDIVLALLLCRRRTAPAALAGTFAISFAYLLGATLWRPDLWGDPLGPLVKVIPTMVLSLMMLGMMAER